MEGTVVVRTLMEKKPNTIDSSDIDNLNSKIQSWDMGTVMAETFRKHDLPPYGAVSNSPFLIKESVPSSASEKKEKKEKKEEKSVNMKILEKSAMWSLVAVMPPLLFVPKIRQKC